MLTAKNEKKKSKKVKAKGSVQKETKRINFVILKAKRGIMLDYEHQTL